MKWNKIERNAIRPIRRASQNKKEAKKKKKKSAEKMKKKKKTDRVTAGLTNYLIDCRTE